jgi:ABC-type branched-subunit amino acid transport system ATPase component
MSGYVQIEVKNYRCFDDSQPLRFQIKKGAVAFTGPNNAGKSSILRFIYEMRTIWSLLAQLSPVNPGNSIYSFLRDNPFGHKFHGVRDRKEVFCNLNDRPLIFTLEFNGLEASGLHIKKINIQITRDCAALISISDNNGDQIGGRSVFANQVNIKNRMDGLDQKETSEIINALSSSLYVGAFRNAINSGGGNYFDLDTGTQFINTWKEWKDGDNVDNRRAILRVTNDIQKLFDLNNLSISPHSNGTALMITADGDTLRADELGSGLSQFIIVLGNLAIKKPKLVLIDEPELNLHPLLQIEFLSMVESYAEYGILFSTHSVGLARSIGNHIYSVLKSGSKSIVKPWDTNKGFLELAGALSYSAWPEMGAGKMLLCEGTTEIKAFQHFLRLFGKDKDVLLMQLGGSAMINGNTAHELSELNRLNAPISVIIDSEKTSSTDELSKERKDFVTNCESLKFKVHVLTLRAFENYLTDDAIKEEKGAKYQALTEYQLLRDISPAWNKSENWKIALRMNKEDILDSDLGKFLEEL